LNLVGQMRVDQAGVGHPATLPWNRFSSYLLSGTVVLNSAPGISVVDALWLFLYASKFRPVKVFIVVLSTSLVPRASIQGLNWGGSRGISAPPPLIWDPPPLTWDPAPLVWDPLPYLADFLLPVPVNVTVCHGCYVILHLHHLKTHLSTNIFCLICMVPMTNMCNWCFRSINQICSLPILIFFISFSNVICKLY